MKKDNRFEIVYEQSSFGNGFCEVLIDKETGVNYLYRAFGQGGGLTVLMDKDGKPLITQGG